MSRMNKLYIARYPAYDIYEMDGRTSRMPIRDGIEYAVYRNMNYEGKYVLVTAGSAAGYAIRNDQCPIESYSREVERGNPTHWLNQNATCLSNMKEERREYHALYVGQVVLFEGRLFVIMAAANDNFKLRELGPAE